MSRARLFTVLAVTVTAAGGVLLLGAAARPVPARAQGASAQTAPALVAEGRAIVERLQCTRCHAATGMGLTAAPRETSCSGCHAWIAGTRHDAVERARQRGRFPYWDRYVENVGSFLAVPDLAAAGARLDAEWIAGYVRDPYAVRPGLYERMLRVPVTEHESRAIAAFLASARRPLAGVAARAAAIPASAAPADVEAGRALYARLRCGTCHALGASDRDAIAGAPDLAHVRERMSSADVAAYIAAPESFGGRSAMPSFDLTAEQAARIRDFLLAATPVTVSAVIASAPDLPLLDRTVAWEEVQSRVFGRICVHCHMDPERNGGEGGPGNTGGLGYDGKGLDLESWEGIAGSTVLVPRTPGAEPPLIARLRARGREHAREKAGHARSEGAGAPTEPGMPMALPPLTPEEFQLIRSWVAHGAPGPDGRRAVATVR